MCVTGYGNIGPMQFDHMHDRRSIRSATDLRAVLHQHISVIISVILSHLVVTYTAD